jgi:TPR repeat protein
MASRQVRLPYPGLRPFRADETDLFFGRESCTDQMVDRLAATRFLAVLGSSGSGKSSLVRTGLLDALELGLLAQAGSRWKIADLRPGGHPIDNLAGALLRAVAGRGPPPGAAEVAALAEFLRRGPRAIIEWCLGGNLAPNTALLILADQFEELFRYSGYTGQQEAEAFVALLIESARARTAPIYIVITMRSEYLGPCALIPDLAEQINAGLYLTRRMTREETREAIEGPAAVCGFAIEPALVNRLLNDLVSFAPWERDGNVDRLQVLARRADQLPLMQHVLNRLWMQAATGGGGIVLKDADYRALGGLSKALSGHADEVLDSLGADRPVAQTVFRALISGASVATAIRQPRRFGELVALAGGNRAAAARVVEAFRDERCNFLLTSPAGALADETDVDISHESLIRQWATLSDWLLAEARSAERFREIETQAKRWRAGLRWVLRDNDLREALAWRDREQPSWVWAKRYSATPESDAGFVAAMDFIRESELRWRRGRANRRLAGLGVAAVAVLVAVIGGGRLFEGYAKGRGDAYYFGQDEAKNDVKAMTWYRRAAALGNTDAARYVGLIYDAGGDGIAQDFNQAMIWYRKAAAAGDPHAEYEIGLHYESGEGVPQQDDKQAMTWFLKAAGGDERADFEIAYLYDYGDGVPQNYQTAMKWYLAAEMMALPKGDENAENNIGVLYDQGLGLPPDGATALIWFRKAAAQGDAAAQRNIGTLYENGDGVNQSYAQALLWYQQAAAQGNYQAEFDVGRFYREGDGVKPDYAEALTWLNKAADGDADADYEIGYVYRVGGSGVKQDYAKAMTYYRKIVAADPDNYYVGEAEVDIGFMYDFGEGVITKDPITALAWYRKAAAVGDVNAENDIGVDYHDGTGVKRDLQQALFWYQKAAEGHNPRADENLGDMYTNGDLKEDDDKAIYWYQHAVDDAGNGDANFSVAIVEFRLYQLFESGNSMDMSQALDWLKRAANDGSSQAEEKLGTGYVTGTIVATDYGKAMTLFKQAANGGETDADIDIALLYLNGQGVTENDATVISWFQNAEAGKSKADIEDEIGWRYMNGNGVATDHRLALKWFTKAATDGDSDAAEQAGYLYLQMNSPAQATAYFHLDLDIDQAELVKYPTNVDDMGNLAWDLILNKQPGDAEKLARSAIAAAPTLIWLQGNLADALMIQGQFGAAKAIYLKYQNVQDAGNGESFTDDVLDDFKNLRLLGYDFPLMAEIAKDFGG